MNLHQIIPPTFIPEETDTNNENPTTTCECDNTVWRKRNFGTYTENHTVDLARQWDDWDNLQQEYEGDDGWECTNCGNAPTEEILEELQNY